MVQWRLKGSHGAERRISKGEKRAPERCSETYRGKQHLYVPSVRGFHSKVRFVVGKLLTPGGERREKHGTVKWIGGMRGRTLSTLPVILTGWDAPTKSLRRAALTRGETSSSDIAVVASGSDGCAG